MQSMGMGMGMGLNMGMNMGMMGGLGYMESSWDWAVCHSGSWIYQQNQYMWVPGQIRHHQPPVRWVRTGGRVGWVPIHPGDVNGKLPLNAQHGVFTVNKGNRLSVERTSFNPAGGVKLLDNAPREFRKPFSPALARTDAPHMEAHMIRPGLQTAGPAGDGNKAGGLKAGGPRAGVVGAGDRSGTLRAGALRSGIDNKGGPGAGIPIVFDHRSQSFMMSRQVIQGNNVRTVTEPVGSYLARSGGADFGGRQSFQGGPGEYRGPGGVDAGNGASPGFRGGGVFNGGNSSRGGEPGFGAGASRGPSGGQYGAQSGTPAGGQPGGFSGGAPSSGGGGGGFQGGGGGGGFSGGGGGGLHGGGGAPSGGGAPPSGGGHR